MARSDRGLSFAVLVVGSGAVACTFTGLGNYDVETCSHPKGAVTVVQKVGAVSDLTFSSASGNSVVGAFAANVNGGTCIEAVGSAGNLNANCLFLADELSLVPKQPFVVPLAGGYATALVETTAPCTSGNLGYRFSAPSIAGKADLVPLVGATSAQCPSPGITLPSIASLADAATTAITWYEAPYASRQDPIESCAGATAVPLDLAFVTSAASGSPVLGRAVRLTNTSTSVRAAAVIASSASQALVAAPLASDVGVWTVDAKSDPAKPLTIPALAGARAVSIAIAADGSGRIAVAAEIGCAPQAIVLAVGTLAGGFTVTSPVAAANGSLAVAPSVAWITADNRWSVAWISASGGAHVLTRSFDAEGHPLGTGIDPSMSATGAVVTSSADVFGFQASSSTFVSTSLGCTP